MTTFLPPLRTGKNTGVRSTSTLGEVVSVQEIDVSANGKTNSITLPDNAVMLEPSLIQLSAVAAALTQGVIVRIGTQSSSTAYGTFTNVSAEGFYASPTLTKAINSAGGIIVVETTASVAASAASYTGGKSRVRIPYIVRI